MSNHLTGKEIDYYVSGLASDKDAARVRKHITTCPQCRKLIETLSSVVTEHPSESVPNPRVRDTVMSHWQMINSHEAGKKAPTKPFTKRFAAGLAFAASFILIISAYLFFNMVNVDEGYSLTLQPVAGEVYINGSTAADNSVVTEGSIIKTGLSGTAVVSTSGYNLYTGSSSSLTISRNSIKTGIQFILDEGDVISKSEGIVKYSFNCGKYNVSPLGTNFMIRFSSGNIIVAVTEGRVKVTAPDISVEIPGGKMWSSEKPGQPVPVDSATASMINSGIFKFDSVNKDRAEKETGKPGITSAAENGKSEISNAESEEKRSRDEKREKLEIRQNNRELRQERKDIDEIKREQRAERKGRKMN